MRLRTLWGYRLHPTTRQRVNRLLDALAFEIAEHLPNRIRYWAFVQVGSDAITPEDDVTTVVFIHLVERTTK